MPKNFAQPGGGPKIETWDLADLLKWMNGLEDINALAAAAKVLDEELGPTGSANVGRSLHQLPPNPLGQGFVGRETDLIQLRALNPAAGAVLTGLRGMGGIGKTALALVLAHEWAPRFPDAQLFLDARGTQPNPPGAGDLLAQVIHAFYLTAKLPDDEGALKSLCHDTLHGRKALLLVDNARDAAQVAPLIPPAGCALIVTSRQNFLLGKTAPHAVGKLPDNEATALLCEYHPALGDALANLGQVHAALGDTRKAIEFYEQQLAIVRELGDRRGEGTALWNAALSHDSLGNRAEAIPRAAAALAIFEAIEEPGAAKVRTKLAEWRGAGG